MSRSRISNEVHFFLLVQMTTAEEWKNYSEAYPHLATDDYFWKKLMVKFPKLTADECHTMNWVDALHHVDFNFTLIHAFETNNIQLTRRVLDYGGNVYQQYQDNLLFLAIIRQHYFDMARLFLKKGFDIDMSYRGTFTVLIYCIMSNDVEGVTFLLDSGANVNAVMVDPIAWPYSALFAFCISCFYQPNDDMLQVLTDYGVDYNLKNRRGEVAFHFIIVKLYNYMRSNPRTIDVFLVKRIFTLFIQKTDMSIVDMEGKTFLHALCSTYYNDERQKIIVDLYLFLIAALLDAGVPINALDNRRETAYTMVDEEIGGSICEFLRQNGGLSQDELVI